MTSLAETLEFACARCGEHKPADEFPQNVSMVRGVDSWCLECRRVYSREHIGRNVKRIAVALERGDALGYSRHVCEHVAWYVQRKITEFEATQQREAPPHMTAILAIARSITAQHPESTRRGVHELVCRRCGEPFEARSPHAMYCHACGVLHRKEQERTYRLSPAGKAARRLQKKRAAERDKEARAAYPPEPWSRRPSVVRMIQCERCGTTMERLSGTHRFCSRCRIERQRDAKVQEQRRAYRQAYFQTEKGKELRRRHRKAWKQRDRERKRAEKQQTPGSF